MALALGDGLRGDKRCGAGPIAAYRSIRGRVVVRDRGMLQAIAGDRDGAQDAGALKLCA